MAKLTAEQKNQRQRNKLIRKIELGEIGPDKIVKLLQSMHGAGPIFQQKKVRETILKGWRLGMDDKSIAHLAGIRPRTFTSWLSKAETGLEPYLDWFLEGCQARAEGESVLLGRIIKAGEDPRHWTANAWIMERRRPEVWGRGQDKAAVLKLMSGGDNIEKTPEQLKGAKPLLDRIKAANDNSDGSK